MTRLHRNSLVSLNCPLSMLPSVIILGIDVENLFSQLELLRRIIKPFDNNSTVMPHLVILRVLVNNVGDVIELFVQVFLQCFENLSSVMPDGVIRRIKSQSISCELQGSFRLLLR